MLLYHVSVRKSLCFLTIHKIITFYDALMVV